MQAACQVDGAVGMQGPMVTALQQRAALVSTNAATLADTRQRLASGERLLRPSDDIGATTAASNQQTMITTYREGLRASALGSTVLELDTRLLDLVNLPVVIRTVEDAQEVQREPVQQKAPIVTATPTPEAA